MKLNTDKIILTAVLLLVVLSSATQAQSVYIMPFLPTAKGMLPSMDAPPGVRREIAVRDEVYGAKGEKLVTDTHHIQDFDAMGRSIKYIGFSSAKRTNPSYKEYWDEFSSRMYSYAYSLQKVGDTVLNVSDIICDNTGQKLSAVSYLVSQNGDTTIINPHRYVYNDKKQLTFQCDMCDKPGVIKRYFTYRNNLLKSFFEYHKDTLDNYDKNELTYDKDGRIIKYKRINTSGKVKKLMDEYDYEYKRGLLTKETMYLYFEPETKRITTYEYNKDSVLIKSVASIANDSTVTRYIYKDKVLVKMEIKTTFPLLVGDYIRFDAKARKTEAPRLRTIERVYLYDKKGNRYGVENRVDGNLLSRSRKVWEY